MEISRKTFWPVVAAVALAAMASAADGDMAAARGGDIRLTLGNCTLGCGNKGFGVLAEYPAPGPGRVTLVRHTVQGAAKVKPTYFDRWGSICGLRIYDPDGNLAKYVELGDQMSATAEYVVDVPKRGKGGIWRISVSGGLNADKFDISFPRSEAWGVRGEKALKLISGAPDRMYAVFAPCTRKFYLTGSGVAWTADGAEIQGEKGRSLYGPAVLAERPEGARFVELSLDPSRPAVFFADGVPGLLSPTKEMAARLNGGLVKSGEEWLEGPLQARLNDYIRKWRPEDFAVPAATQAVSRAYVRCDYSKQELDSSSPNYGSTRRGNYERRPSDLFHYMDNGYEPAAFAARAAVEDNATRGTTYRNSAAVRRAVLSAFNALAHMDACGLLRQTLGESRSLKGGRIDCPTMFEPFNGITRAYYLLRPLLSPEEDSMFREAVLQVADKEAGFICYQSNQWMHILEGFNCLFCATGEMRMERYLRLQLEAFLGGVFTWKHGQHPAGFYAEEGGPDGNYDQMSSHPMAHIYYTYQKQPGASKELVAKIKESLERNFVFRSMFAVPDPANGKPYQMAYAMNHRTEGPTHFDSHFGLFVCSHEFDMAWTLLKLGSDDEEDVRDIGGADGALRNAQPRRARRVPLPYQAKELVMDLPGFLGVKRGRFWSVHFWKVYDRPDGLLGPLFLWHEQAGMGLCGTRHSYGEPHRWFTKDMGPADITFSTVYGRLDGELFIPSRRMAKKLEWNEPGKSYTVTGTLYGPRPHRNAEPPVRGTISWKTDFVSADKVAYEVCVDLPGLEEPVVNLVFLRQNGRTVWSHEGWRPWRLKGGRFAQESKTGFFIVDFPKDTKADVVEKMTGNRGWPMALRLAVPPSGRIKFTLTALGKSDR